MDDDDDDDYMRSFQKVLFNNFLESKLSEKISPAFFSSLHYCLPSFVRCTHVLITTHNPVKEKLSSFSSLISPTYILALVFYAKMELLLKETYFKNHFIDV